MPDGNQWGINVQNTGRFGPEDRGGPGGGPGVAAIENIGVIRATGSSIFLDNVSTLFGGIHNSGVISSTSFAGVVVDNVFTLSGGITNLSGGTIGAAKTGVLVENGSTFSGGISNAGTISAGSAGIELRNIAHFSGGVSNAGAILGTIGIQLIGIQSASVFDAGTIVGSGGTAIEFSGWQHVHARRRLRHQRRCRCRRQQCLPAWRDGLRRLRPGQDRLAIQRLHQF